MKKLLLIATLALPLAVKADDSESFIDKMARLETARKVERIEEYIDQQELEKRQRRQERDWNDLTDAIMDYYNR